ncbi:MAG: helix-turn-helix domain-containing protein, partial [Roseovarius sp.]|nr:helix-turn-helix domain-containing protein [Roseovarius sp.]
AGFGPRGPGEIWGEWLAGRERPAPKYYRTPVYEYGEAAEFLEGLRQASQGLRPEVRCLFVQVESLNGYGDAAPLRALLSSHPGLQEIRLRFLDGRLVWLVKDEGGRVISESEEADPTDPVHLGHDLPIKAIFKVRMRPRWSTRRPTGTLREMLREARNLAGLDLPEVARRLLDEPTLGRELSSYRGAFRGVSDLRAWEAGPSRAIPFPLLRALAGIYGQDVRTWIAASNRDLHPAIPRRLWEGEGYPLYLELKTDLDRVREFDAAPEGRGRGSFGRRLFEARKNPDQYFSALALAERVGILPKMLHDFERNHHSPNAATLRALTEALNLTEADLAGAISRTFHSELPLADLFPGQAIFLTPHSLDAAKVAGYARDPGSLGQYLFASRKLRPGFPSADEISAELGRNPNYFSQHEANAVHFGRDNLHEWLWLWNRMGLPRELFLEIAERRHGIPQGDPAYLLAEALEGRSLEQVQAQSEISTKTLSAILQQRGNLVTPASLLSLKEALPRLDAARLYLHYYPELPHFFPELNGP